MTILDSESVGIGTSNPSTLLVLLGAIILGNNVWHNSTKGTARFFYDAYDCSYFLSENTGSTNGYIFRNTAQGDILTISDAVMLVILHQPVQ